MEVLQEILRLPTQRNPDAIALVEEHLVAVRISGGVHGHIRDSTAGGVKDDEPQRCSLILGVGPFEDVGNAGGVDQFVTTKSEGFGVERRGETGEVQSFILGVASKSREPVVVAYPFLITREAGGDAAGAVLGFGAVERAGDDGAGGVEDEFGAEATVEFGIGDQVLPGGVGGSDVGGFAEEEGVAVLDDVGGFGMGTDDELGDDAETGGGSSETLFCVSRCSWLGRRLTYPE